MRRPSVVKWQQGIWAGFDGLFFRLRPVGTRRLSARTTAARFHTQSVGYLPGCSSRFAELSAAISVAISRIKGLSQSLELVLQWVVGITGFVCAVCSFDGYS